MKRTYSCLILLGGWLLAAACGSTTNESASRPREAASGAPEDWEVVMERVSDEKDFLESQFLLNPLNRVDLPRVAASARRTAELLALGYGRLEEPRIPGFAGYARAAEAWMLELAVEAEAGRAEIARDLIDLADQKHCVECHEAADKVKW